jgi:TRAP-type C4-dicarboxylate transport system substrate-binding protein
MVGLSDNIREYIMTEKFCLAGAAFLLSSVLFLNDAQAFEGRLAALAPPDSPWEKSWTTFQAALNEIAPEIRFEYFIRGELGNEDEMLAQTRRNRIQIMGPSLQGLAVIVPELTIPLAPYLFESTDEVDFVYDNYLVEPVSQLLNEKGLIFVTWSDVGWTDIYANKPIRLPADIQDLKLRGAPNVAAQIFLRDIGANSVPVGSVDIVQALQTGLVKGGASNLIFHYYATREYATHVTLTHHAYDTGGVVANKKWWDTASPQEQQAIIDAFGPPSNRRMPVRALLTDVIQWLRAEGVDIYELTPGERAEWVTATDGQIQTIIDRVGGRSQLIYDAIVEGKAAFEARSAVMQDEANDPAARTTDDLEKNEGASLELEGAL